MKNREYLFNLDDYELFWDSVRRLSKKIQYLYLNKLHQMILNQYGILLQ